MLQRSKNLLSGLASGLRWTLLCTFLLSCSELEDYMEDQETKQDESSSESNTNQVTTPPITNIRNSSLVDISTRMTEVKYNFDSLSQDAASLSLTTVSKYTIRMENCLSGYTHDTTELDPNIRAYKFDSNCLAKLLTFEYDNITYVPTASDPFTSWQVGDSAFFEDENDANNTLYVKVLATLSNPILGTEVVNYGIYHNVNVGDNRNILDVTLGAQGTATKQKVQTVPTFEIVTVNLIGETLTGGFQVEVIVNCSTMMSGDVCGDYNLADTTYALGQDTYGGAPKRNDLNSLHNSSGVAVDLNFDKLLPGEMGATNGGFKTTTGANILTTPDDVHLNPNMILSIEGLAESWQYFNVDVVIQSNF